MFGEEEKSEQAEQEEREVLIMIVWDFVGKTLHRRGRREQQRCHRLKE